MKKISKKLKYISGLCAITIIVIATFFHYPIHIVDALTLNTILDFDIHVSLWRTIFEPVFGLLLFFNRALYGLDELIYSLYWVLIVFFAYLIIKFVVTKDNSIKKKIILKQLANLPIIIGLWFTVFVIVIFMSVYFPANTIINNAPNTILVTTHSHSQFSHDGLIRQERLWKWHKYNNFDAFFITDHNTHDKTLDFVNAQRKGEFPIEPLVMCGEEFSGSNHLSLLGLKSKFDTHDFTDSTAIDSTRANNGAIIVNHWFDGEHMSLEHYNNLGVDGFEIENTGTERTYDRKVYHKIKDFCEQNSLIMNVGLDFHGYGNVCTAWNAIKVEDWHNLNPNDKEKAILEVIKNRDQSKLKVLMYNDRPYYTDEYLFWSPVFTFINYFRTLNIWQVLSWIIWITIITFIKLRISNNEFLKKLTSANKTIAIKGFLSSVFILLLGGVYYAEIARVAGSENDVYKEYSMILFYVGVAFIVYSSIIAFFRIFRNKNLIS